MPKCRPNSLTLSKPNRISMYPKFIIAGSRLDGKSYLRMGMVIHHKDLRIGYEKIWGGGWWSRNDETKTIILYGCSLDFGSPDFRHMKKIDREFRDYTIIFTPLEGVPGNVLDTSEIEWI